MNTDIQFQISAPASLSLFGDHTNNKLSASIDLRTTLIFQEVQDSLPNDIKINFSQINLFYTIPLQQFLPYYNICIRNEKLLHEIVLQLPFQYESINQKIFLQIFFYFIIFITYKEQIQIKSFTLTLTTPLTLNGEFMSPTSLKVCLVACLLHWSRLQTGAHRTFDETDLKKICDYVTMCCEKIDLELYLIDTYVCTYGSIIKETEQKKVIRYESLRGSPSMKILLVDSNHSQDAEIQKQQFAELNNMFPELVKSILNNLCAVMKAVNGIFETIFDIYKNDELNIEMKDYYFLQEQKKLEVSHNKNSIKKFCSIVCLCCVFCIIFFHFI